MFVGAPFDVSGGSQSGSVSIYREVSDDNWELFEGNKVSPGDGNDGDQFGVSLDIDDSSTFVIGSNVSITCVKNIHLGIRFIPHILLLTSVACESQHSKKCRCCIFIRNNRYVLDPFFYLGPSTFLIHFVVCGRVCRRRSCFYSKDSI